MPRLVSPRRTNPFFGYDKRAVYVAFREVYLSPLLEVFGQCFENIRENPFLNPSLKAAMAGLVGWVAFWKVFPGRSSAKYPENAVQDVPWVSPGSSPTVFSARRLGDKRLQHFPLLVGEIQVLLLLPRGCTTEPLYPRFHIYEIASSETPAVSLARRSRRRLSDLARSAARRPRRIRRPRTPGCSACAAPGRGRRRHPGPPCPP